MAKLRLNPALIQKITQLIEDGNYDYVAAQSCGIHEKTFYEWLKIGEKSPKGIYCDFYEAVKIAEAKAEVLRASRIKQAGEMDWRADAWYLERKYPDRWGKVVATNNKTEISAPQITMFLPENDRDNL